MSQLVLTHDETIVSLDPLGDLGFLDAPFPDVAHDLITDGRLLGSLRDGPSRGPVRGELFQKGSLDLGGL